MRCVLLRMLEGGLCLLGLLEVPEMMALCAVPYAGGARGAGGDALCAALYVWRVSSVIDALCAYLVSSGGESTGLIWHDDGRVGNCFAVVTLIHFM